MPIVKFLLFNKLQLNTQLHTLNSLLLLFCFLFLILKS